MEKYFVLDERGEPLPESDVDVWSRWFERSNRSVARTVVTPSITVLTTFRGVDEIGDDGDTPLLFDTRVFGGVLDGEERQHRTRAEAIAGHAALAEWCRIGNAPDAGVSQPE